MTRLKDQTLVHQIEIKASDDGIEILEFSEWMQEIEEEEEEEVVMNERISNSQCTICLSTLKNELVFVLVQIDSSEQGDSKIGAKIDAHSETECRLTFRIDTSHFKHDTREISLIEYITTLQLFVVGKMSDVHLYTLKGECQFKVALHSMEVVSCKNTHRTRNMNNQIILSLNVHSISYQLHNSRYYHEYPSYSIR